MKLAGVLNSADVKALIPQISSLAAQKAQQEQATQQTAQQAQVKQQQVPVAPIQQPVAQVPVAPAPIQASVDTSGKYGAMRRVKNNIQEGFIQNYKIGKDFVKKLKKQGVDFSDNGELMSAIKKEHPEWSISDIMEIVKKIKN